MIRKTDQIAAELADREAIRDCIYRYCRGIDRIDRELLLSAYWPDAIDEHGNFSTRSAEEFANQAISILGTMVLTTHVVHNILIDIRGPEAHVETYVQAFHTRKREDGTFYDHMSSSRFLDRMERRDGEWRISHRAVVRDWFREFAEAHEWAEGELGQALGYGRRQPLDIAQRSPEDLSYQFLDFFRDNTSPPCSSAPRTGDEDRE